MIEIDNLLSSYLPKQFPIEKVCFFDTEQQPIEFKTKSVTQKVKSILGTYNISVLYANLGGWLRKQKAYLKDYIIFTVVDWQNGVFQLEREQYAKRQVVLLEQQNQLLANMFYELLENAAKEELYTYVAVPTVYARLPEKSAYPPDHWVIALKGDKRMSVNDWSIRYSEHRLSPLEKLAKDITGESRRMPNRPIQKEQAGQVYRFKAELKHNPKIWREVEILGKQSLAELSTTLVNAFKHDSDHMSGFWKLVPRKATSRGVTRYREVELGNINPFGEGDGSDVKIAGLELSVDAKLKFVFDFGDWIEHILTLIAIEPPLTSTQYPREIARNQPKHIYCVECADKAKKTVAKWICVTCTNEQQKKLAFCQKCGANHEDHYLEEIMY
ncbi:MAG: hypothetical protein NTW32_07275 [Chloroflexi bacterium]|nr:hypothetical protein [Chloroflexota bacterium]